MFFFIILCSNSFDKNLRHQITLEKKTDDNIENLIRCLLPNMIPKNIFRKLFIYKGKNFQVKMAN